MTQSFSVLIVEDNEDACGNMADILSLDDYEIATAVNRTEAFQLMDGRPFDAIIADWKLPEGNGDEFVIALAKMHPGLPVVIVTGLREFDAAIQALRSGAYDFLLKPINPEALRSAVRRLVERKANLRKLEDAQQKLLENERLAAIGQMVAGLAHESRNAFQRSHACLAELSLDLTDRPDSQKLVIKVQNALDDLNKLLEEVRNYSAPIILERRKVSLSRIVEESWHQISTVNPHAQSIEFRLLSPPGFNDESMIDPHRLQQVMRNLFDNSVAAVNGRGTIEVTIADAGGKPDAVCLMVSDSGSGIANEIREKVFTPFFTTKTKGTGLGLAISKRIVEAHAGTIEVRQSPAGGTIFSIELPRGAHRPAEKRLSAIH